MKNVLTFDVEFGDTDPAELVFYPNFFRWFDAGSWRLLKRAGLSLKVFREEFDVMGFPIVEAKSNFLKPVHFGDTVQLSSHVHEFQRKTLRINHQIHLGSQLCVEGYEIRTLTKRTGEKSIKAVVIPEEIKRRLTAD